jgi:putative endonuclease
MSVKKKSVDVRKKMSRRSYIVYIVECCDHSYYTGIAIDVAERVRAHNECSGRGARYTRSRQPVTLVYTEKLTSKSNALRREYTIKQLPRHKKQELVDSFASRRYST